jgi:fumarylacetoacetate (FAA) hydrolase
MKLASLRHGRDGRLVVVSDDLAWCAHEPSAPTLQAALDDWTHAEPRLRALSDGVNAGSVLRERFHEREAASPLPRA